MVALMVSTIYRRIIARGLIKYLESLAAPLPLEIGADMAPDVVDLFVARRLLRTGDTFIRIMRAKIV